MNVTILGAGAFGTALGSVLEENHHHISYYDPFVYPKISLKQSLRDAEAVIVAIPSEDVHSVLQGVPAALPVVCASKGFLGIRPTDKFTDHFSVLSGGAFASELESKKPSALTATSTFAKDLFATPWLTIELTDDETGVLLCGALKNLYAIYAGYHAVENAPEVSPENYQKFIERAVKELADVLAENGGKKETAELSCGKTDLEVTCASPESRNYSFGASLRARLDANITRPVVEATTEGLAAYRAIKSSDSAKISPDFTIPDSAVMLKEVIALLDKHYAYAQ